MIRSTMSVLAENVLVDPQTNQLSLIGIYEEAHPAAMPLMLPRLTFITFLERDESDPSEISVKIKVQINDEVLLANEVPIKFGDKLRVHSISNFKMALIPTAGEFVCSLSAEGEEIGRSSITVIAPPPAPEAPATEGQTAEGLTAEGLLAALEVATPAK